MLEEYEIDLTALVYGGDAMGRLPDGRAVFVPYALPGERVRLCLVDEKRGHARAKLLEVIKPSDERISPLCQHFGTCGGCHYQHMAYDRQIQVKTAILGEQLERIGGFVNPPVQPMRTSPGEWHYRNNLQFHLTAEGKPGYLKAASNEVVAIQECHLPETALGEAWQQLDFAPGCGIDGFELRLGVDDDLLLTLEAGNAGLPEFSTDMSISAVYNGLDGMHVLSGQAFTLMEVLGRTFRVSSGSFFQVNTAQAEGMVEWLLQSLPLSQHARLLDVYCGVGLFTAFMAERVGHCTGVEISETACEDFAVNLDESENVDLYVGAAGEVLPGLEGKFDIVLLDPPRAGLERTALDAIAGLNPEVIAYVSCDPSTLARDARRLVEAGYHLQQVTPFDMFPQTYHIESVSILSRV